MEEQVFLDFSFSLMGLSLAWCIFRYGCEINEKKEKEESDKKRDEQMVDQLNNLFQSAFTSTSPTLGASMKKIDDDDFH